LPPTLLRGDAKELSALREKVATNPIRVHCQPVIVVERGPLGPEKLYVGVRVAYTLHPEKPDPANPVTRFDPLPQRQYRVRLGVKHLHVDYLRSVFGSPGQAQLQLDGHVVIFGDCVAIPGLYDCPGKGARTGAPVFSQTSQPQWNPPGMSRRWNFEGSPKRVPSNGGGFPSSGVFTPKTVIAEAPGDGGACLLSCERNT
jgi:hypothetical protein